MAKRATSKAKDAARAEGASSPPPHASPRERVPAAAWKDAVAALADLARTPQIRAIADYRAARPRERTAGGSKSGGNLNHSDNKPGRSILTAKSQATMRARCRAIVRNNSFIRGMVRRLCEHIVGDGYTFTFETTDTEWNEQARVLLTDWADEIGLWRIAQWVVRAWLTDGDALVLKVRTAEGKCLLQAIEADLLVTPDKNGKPLLFDDGSITMMPDGGMISAGVETDANGEVVAYHVAEWGDKENLGKLAAKTGKEQTASGGVWSGLTGTLGIGTVKRIPADQAMFIVPEAFGNPGQHRGEPLLQSVMSFAELGYLWLEDVMVAADMATKFGLIIAAANPALEAKTDDQSLTESAIEMAAAVAAGKDPEIVLETGMVKYVQNVGAVHQVKPEFPTVNTPEFMRFVLSVIGAELGLPPMLATFDMSGTTASNGKMIMSVTYRGFETPMKVNADGLFKKAGRFRTATAIARSELRACKDKDWAKKIRIGTPYAPVMDLNNEGKAWDYLVRNNLATHHDACMQLGSGTGNEVAAKRKQEIDRDRELGITPAETPGAKRPGEASADAGTQAGDGTGNTA